MPQQLLMSAEIPQTQDGNYLLELFTDMWAFYSVSPACQDVSVYAALYQLGTFEIRMQPMLAGLGRVDSPGRRRIVWALLRSIVRVAHRTTCLLLGQLYSPTRMAWQACTAQLFNTAFLG